MGKGCQDYIYDIINSDTIAYVDLYDFLEK